MASAKKISFTTVANSTLGFMALAFCAFVVFAALYARGIVGPSMEERAKASQDHRITLMQQEADNFVARREYIKDPTTNLCFALYPALRTDASPTFSNVPCESVPQNELVVGKNPPPPKTKSPAHAQGFFRLTKFLKTC